MRAAHGSVWLFGMFGLAVALASAAPNASLAAAPSTAGFGERLPGARTLTAFHSEAELKAWLKRRAEAMQARRGREQHQAADGVVNSMPAPAPMAAAEAAPATTASRAAGGDTSITNVQEQGVDEGDIVKIRGDVLVILRRGRLFTVSIAGGGMRPIDSIDAYPPGVNARSDWYDEMLVSGNRVIVIGYSYGRGGTEINRFRLSANGRLRWEDAYHLRSNDYYSSRNYASRLIGTKLIVYSPMYLGWGEDLTASFPGMRRWTGDANAQFKRIVSAQHIYYSPRLPESQVQAIHTVTSCDLSAPVLDCEASSVFGPAGRTFYVSSQAVYVWVTAWGGWGEDDRQGPPPAMLYRLPLDGSAPSAVGVSGSPVDQFSFREDPADRTVNVLVRASGHGDAMWAPENSGGAIALLRVPFDQFGDGSRDIPDRRYRLLPQPGGQGYDFHNRFVGDYVLYGNGSGWGRPEGQEGEVVVAGVRNNNVTRIETDHGVDRIEVMGRDAVVVGSDRENVYFLEVKLGSRGMPRAGSHYTMEGAAQAETRSHGFFYKGESANGDEGVLGLPVARPATPAYRHLFQTSAAIVFLRREAGRFHDLGDLVSRSEGAVDDGCVASCVDWYGNARPIFLGNRTFALMGYELVEGRLGSRHINEVARTNFAPEGHGWRRRPAETN